MFYKKTIREIDLTNQRVLVRVDFNVPISDGKISDDYRIKQALPTIKHLLEYATSIVLISHLGRPDGKPDKKYSLAPIAKRLGELLEREVSFVDDCIGEKVQTAAAKLEHGGILLLENLRFYPEEEKNDEEFARNILDSTGAGIFVQEGFGVVHRAHASTDAIARQGRPAVAGLLLEKEVDTLTNIMSNPEKPLVAIIGGAKISDKIEILNRLIDVADCVAVAGALANNFLLAQNVAIGKSTVDQDSLDTAKDILERAKQVERERPFHFLVPVDVVVSEAIDGSKTTRLVDLSSHTIADIMSYPKVPAVGTHEVTEGELILDIGPVSAARIAGTLLMARTALWNGTCGVTEAKGLAGAQPPFSHGTKQIVEAMIGHSKQHPNAPFSVVGGGDTVAYVEAEGLVDEFDHVSTGGGASLELMSGKTLPGVEVLWNREGY